MADAIEPESHSRPKRALVLGGTGFIGSALVYELLAQGYQVTCLLHKTALPKELEGKVTVLRGSLPRMDWKEVETPDVVFHLARIAGVRKLGRYVASLRSTAANTKILRWLESLEKPPLLIYVAGTLAYGTREEIVTEDIKLTPTSYAKDYGKGELPFVRALKGKVPIMLMRAAWVYGKGSWFERFYMDHIVKKRLVPVYDKGDNWMSFIHVEDCARLILHYVEGGKAGETYNLFVGKPLKQKKFAEELGSVVDLPLDKINMGRLRYSKATIEAFNFSLQVGTKHTELYERFNPKHPEVKEGLFQLFGRKI